MKKGFTLFEILITIALMTTITLILFPFAVNTVATTNLNVNADQLYSTFFRVQQDAFNGRNNQVYALTLNSNSYSILSGPNTTNLTAIETFTLNSTMSIQNISLNDSSNQFIFNVNSLIPSTTGSFRLVSSEGSFTFSINNEGLIEYSKT